MLLANKQQRARLADLMKQALETDIDAAVKEAMRGWLDNMNDAAVSREHGDKLKELLPKFGDNELLAEINAMSKLFTKKSFWVFLGDGAAYDIAFGGVDHVLATGEDINATPTGSIAKFAASGKKTAKKDMGGMAMTYGYVYVASVAMGANKQQLMKALTEAEAYNGPSLIMCYAPCINHGIKKGMGKSQEEMKLAVLSGYWPLYRFNPQLKDEGKNPFTLDSKDPDGTFQEFLAGEVRYAALQKTFPEEAKRLTKQLEKEYSERYQHLKEMAGSGEATAKTES